MKGFSFDPALFARTYRDPLAIAFLVVDVLPIVGVIAFGWNAVPLVFLYWLENLVIGLSTIVRMVLSGVRGSLPGLFAAAFMSAFFTVHYGMFCFVHGQFLAVLAGTGQAEAPDFFGPVGLVQHALGSGTGMAVFVAAILVVNLVAAVRDSLDRRSGPDEVSAIMFSPYGRIVVLHIGIFAGFGALVALGQPMLGVLALILLRVIWGIAMAVLRQLREERGAGAKVDVSSANG